MTLQLPSQLSKLVDKMGKIVTPWNIFFQQLVSAPSPIMDVDVTASPFIYDVGEPGTVFVTGGAITSVEFIRGSVTLNVGTLRLVQVNKQDQVKITYTVLPTVKFIPFYFTPR